MAMKFLRATLASLAVLMWAGAVCAQGAPLVAQSVTAQGVMNGKPVMIEMLVAAPKGADAQGVTSAAAAQARKQGVEVSDEFSLELAVWSQFFDKRRSNNVVTVNFNPSGAPMPGTVDALKAVLATWNAVKGSTFQYAFGGQTTRTPVLGDGFNDVAFVPGDECGGICILAETIFSRDPKTSALTEFDILVFNRSFGGLPFWTLDPATSEGFDWPTVMLHELGHGAGLGHSANEAAVMYFAVPYDMRKPLTSSDTSAIAFLYPPKPSSLASTSSPSDKHNYNLLAALGSPAPGGGTYVDHFEVGQNAINKDGATVFAADVDTPAESLFLASKAGSVTRLLSPGQTVSGIVLGDHTISSAAINDVGGIAVNWAAYPGDYRLPLGIDSTVLRKSAKGEFQAVIVPRVTPVPGGGVFYGAYLQLGLSQAGDVAFLGLIQSAFGNLRQGVFVAQANGTIVSVAQPAAPAPGGGVFGNATWVSIASQGGYVAFTASTGASASAASLPGVFLRDPARGLVRIAGYGDPAIGGGQIYNVLYPQVNANGDVLFVALTYRQGDQYSQYVPYVYSKGSLKAVVRNGEMLPDGRTFLSLEVTSNRTGLGMNDAGDVILDAIWTSRQYGGNWLGYYGSWKGTMEYIARDFDPILGAELFPRMEDIASIGNHGDVVFQAVGYGGTGTTYLIRASRKVYTQ